MAVDHPLYVHSWQGDSSHEERTAVHRASSGSTRGRAPRGARYGVQIARHPKTRRRPASERPREARHIVHPKLAAKADVGAVELSRERDAAAFGLAHVDVIQCVCTDFVPGVAHESSRPRPLVDELVGRRTIVDGVEKGGTEEKGAANAPTRHVRRDVGDLRVAVVPRETHRGRRSVPRQHLAWNGAMRHENRRTEDGDQKAIHGHEHNAAIATAAKNSPWKFVILNDSVTKKCDSRQRLALRAHVRRY